MTQPPAPQGAPRSWDPERQFVQVSREAVARLGLTDAYVFALVLFKSRNIDGWAATVAEVAEEGGIPTATARKALDRLRDGGHIAAHRADPYKATLTWQIRWSDGADLRGHPDLTSEVISEVTPEVISSYKKVDKKNQKVCNGSAVGEMARTLDHLALADFDAASVLAAMSSERPDITSPAAFLEHLDSEGSHAARGFLDGLAIA